MTTPLTILFADDQLPWPTDAENARTKAEIRREFAVAKPQIDVDLAFAEDKIWFTGLLDYLEQTKGETVIRARTFQEASRHLEDPQQFDVAILDLSWWGDHTLPPGAATRRNRGLQLLTGVTASAGAAGRQPLPIVVLSQNFSTDFEQMGTVLERGGMPVPKNYQSKEIGYRALYAAVQYLAANRRQARPTIQLFISHAHQDQDLARRLVRALELAFIIPVGAIRCTSVPGYDIAPGADFMQSLKDDITGARCVVGLWTAASLRSQWCLFELGAAWGLAHKTLLLCQDDALMQDPPAGFRSIQTSRLSDAVQLRRFVDEIARSVGWPASNRRAADIELDDLARYALSRQ